MKKKLYIFALIAIASHMLTACSNVGDDIIWIDDKEYPELPAYTEWGYNTFGAHVNDYTIATDREGIFDRSHNLIKTDGTKICFILKGEDDHYTGNMPEFRFTLPVERVENFVQLAQLDKRTFDLTSEQCETYLTEKEELGLIFKEKATPIKVKKGNITYQRVQVIYLDNQLDGTILSGTFEFDGVTDNDNAKTYHVTHGRFDVTIQYRTFKSWDESEYDDDMNESNRGY